MKICIDSLAVNHLHGTGLYSYNFELLNNLFEIYPQPKYELIWENNEIISRWEKYKNINYANLNLNRIKNNYSNIEEYIKNNNINIYHSPNNGFSIPFNKNCKQVITVHDLIALTDSEYVDKKYLMKFNDIFPNSVEKSDKIIAVSDFVKKELTNHFKNCESKIEVIYPGCSNIFRPIEKEKSKSFLKDKYNIKDDFLLYAGSIHKRKNLDKLIKAFKEVKKYNKDLKLLIVGKNNEKREEYYLNLKKLSKDLFIEDSVIFTGLVDYKDMPYFYNSSTAVLNLSDYEGFPLSSIEAMSCKKAVICSKTSSFEEVLGKGSILINKNDISIIKDVILETVNNEEYRNDIENKGKIQSQKYKWDTSNKKLVNVYESIA